MTSPLARVVRVAALAAIAVSAGLLAQPADAAALPAAPTFQLPFRCGETWNGNNPGSSRHRTPWELDFNRADDIGDPVLAAAAGTVIEAAHQGSTSGYGNLVVIDHGGGWRTYYAHLNSIASGIAGQHVTQGQLIGTVGNSSSPGNDISPHLHYEVRNTNDGGYPENIQPAVFNGVRFPYPAGDVTSHNCGGSSAPVCSGPATVYGVVGNSTPTVTQLSNPATGGPRSLGAKVLGQLPFTAQTLAALDYNTLFATDGNRLHRIDVINFNGTADSIQTRVVGTSGWTTDRFAYDGYGHLYGITDGQLRRYNLSGNDTYGIVSNTLLGASGWTLATATGTANEWMLATTATGELVSYDLNPIRRYSLRPSTWTFRNLISPGGGVYYAQNTDGALFHYVDRDHLNGRGDDITAAKTIDPNGWTQRLLTAQPRICN